MGAETGISWTDATWNPVVGCSIVSPGCTNCYAMAQAARIVAMQPSSHYAGTTQASKGGPVWTGKVALAPDHILTAPLKWKKPRRIFVNSMGDLFHESVPDAWIDKVFAVVALRPQHTFQLLTKRSARLRSYCSQDTAPGRIWAVAMGLSSGKDDLNLMSERMANWPLPNIHLGVSAEDQARADERIPDLLATPAAVRFVSYEPALGPIDFRNVAQKDRYEIDALTGFDFDKGAACERLDWIITGGESGPGHRPMQMEWAEAVWKQCYNSGTAFFFKQDSGPRSGMKGRASADLWACKEFPK